MAKRTNVQYQGVKIALPRGSRTLTADMKATIDAEYSARRWNAAKGGECRGIFYNKDTFVLRCSKNRKKTRRKLNPKTGRKRTVIVKSGGMSTAAKRRYARQVRRKELCHKGKRGRKGKLFTTRC